MLAFKPGYYNTNELKLPFSKKKYMHLAIFTLFDNFLHSVRSISKESFHASDGSNPNMR